MAEAKIKKIKGNVTKLNYFHAYIVNVISTWITAWNSSSCIYIKGLSEVMVKCEFRQ